VWRFNLRRSIAQPRFDRFKCEIAVAYADALIATGDPRLVPALIARLGNNSDNFHTISVGQRNEEYTCCLDDHHLYILLGLIGQSPKEHQLHVKSYKSPEGTVSEIRGFTSAQSRATAYANMRTWWTEHKNQPPYKNLQPLPKPAVKVK